MMDNKLQQMNESINSRKDDIFESLKTIINIDSFSTDREGVNKVGQCLKDWLTHLGIEYEVRSQEKYGDQIIATIKGTKPGKILLMGHMDTVHPTGTAQKRPYSEDGHNAYGPGIADMQPGLICMLYAAAAIKQSGIETCDLELLYTSDEEVGSPTSKTIIEERAQDALAVFNLEPGRPDGSVVTGRKGSAHLDFKIEGKASHSGFAIEEGISAIEELGQKIVKLYKLMDLERGMTLNVGLVQGGVNTNVVAPEVTGTVHMGFWKVTDYEEVLAKAQDIFATSFVPGSKSELTVKAIFLPMERNKGVEQMYKIVQKAAQSLDIEITEQITKGAADSGFAASTGVPTICGMSAVGGKYHQEDEYMVLDSFIPRIQLLANSIVLASERFAKRSDSNG